MLKLGSENRTIIEIAEKFARVYGNAQHITSYWLRQCHSKKINYTPLPMSWIETKLSFSLIKSALLCLYIYTRLKKAFQYRKGLIGQRPAHPFIGRAFLKVDRQKYLIKQTIKTPVFRLFISISYHASLLK